MPKFIKLHFDSALREAAPSGSAEKIRIPESIEKDVRSADRQPTPPESRSMTEGQSDESVARAYLGGILEERGRELYPLTAPDDPAIVPDLHVVEIQDSPLTPTRVVKFIQTSKSVPVFGTAAYVEIDGSDRRLVTTDATLTDTPNVSAISEISATQALEAIQKDAGLLSPSQLAALPAAKINFFCDTKANRWHLVYYFRDVPLVPREQRGATSGGHELEGSPRDYFRFYDYLVDAHTGEIVFYFSSQKRSDVPVKCKGLDEFRQQREFYGMAVNEGYCLLDPLRKIETLDHCKNDLSATIPPSSIWSSSVDFGDRNTAGVSAHYHAKLVFDFFNNVLKRNGIDDKGMALVSLVNVTNAAHSNPPNWRNAVWWNNRMWFGQEQNGNGGFDSFARYLDVIAHELSHGVTETTSNLVYRDESGSLNESFSDIFGILVKNWYPGEPNPVSGWHWTIGEGLGAGGGPLRDLSNPERMSQPVHMRDYLRTVVDNGGVHTNSGIHNKAAYNLITATDPAGNFVFSPNEIAILYYLTLARLSRMSGFSDCLRVLKSVISSYFAGDSLLPQKWQAAVEAYERVGIL